MSALACAQSLHDITGDDKVFPRLGGNARFLSRHLDRRWPKEQQFAATAVSAEVGAMLARRGLAADGRRNGPFTLAEVTEMLWQTVADFLPLVQQTRQRQIAKKRRVAHMDEAAFGRAGTAVLEAMYAGTDIAAIYMAPLCVEAVVDHIADACEDAFGHKADAETVRMHVAPACLVYEPSLFLAKTIIRSCIADELFGCSLATCLRRECFLKDWDLGPESYERTVARDAVIPELLAKQAQLLRIKQEVARGDIEEIRAISGVPMFGFEPERAMAQRGRHKDADDQRKAAFAACDVLIEFNTYFSSLPNTLGAAARFGAIDPTGRQLRNLLDKVSSRSALMRTIPILDIAVEEVVKAELAEARCP